MIRFMPGLLILLLLVLVIVTGCGKKGAPVAPGPKDEIIYPKTYPSR